MDALSELLNLSTGDKESLGLVHTLPEILQQPQTWRRTYEKMLRLAAPLETFLSSAGIGASDRSSPNVLLVGAGTSDYIGKSVALLLQREWSCDVQAVPSTDLLTNAKDHIIAGRSYLWISFSRSGDSSEGVAVLEAALATHPQIKHIVVTCNEQGKMAQAFRDRDNVFTIVLDDDVNDRGLAMTSSFSNMVVVAQALAHFRSLLSYGRIVESLATSASLILPTAANICARLVQEGFSKVCFLGTGSVKGAAIESGLKVLELTGGRVISFAESFLGLRHGPLSVIDEDTLVVAFLSADERRRQFELDLITEIYEKGLTSKFLTIQPNGRENAIISPENTVLLELQNGTSDLYIPPLMVLVGQLLGLFASLREGFRPDEPSPDGAISRVVTHVTIH
jgi:tagatose-6-phosphate ketose/aldose isomerase